MPDAPPDPAQELAYSNSRLMEKRMQNQSQGRMSTFLTDFQNQRGSSAQMGSPTETKTLLGQ
jgi:hypothetical protein